MEREYISVTETAKLVRAALKKAFPGIKFSVVSESYAGGASIDIRWEFGPTTKEVDAVGKQYASCDFDGSIDMETSWNHWLMPDGSTRIKGGPGTEGSMGYIQKIEDTPMPEGAKPVRFGAHYVMSQRSFAPKGQYEKENELRTRVAKDMCALQHIEYTGPYMTGLYGSGDFKPIMDHVGELLYATSFGPGEEYIKVRFATDKEREPPNDYWQIMRIIKGGPLVTLECCCCGGEAKGRQWYNRDKGYGLCSNCVEKVYGSLTPEQMESAQGIEGVHYFKKVVANGV
jgi:hypothetical protein